MRNKNVVERTLCLLCAAARFCFFGLNVRAPFAIFFGPDFAARVFPRGLFESFFVPCAMLDDDGAVEVDSIKMVERA